MDKTINFEEFVWFDLGPKPPEMMINVSETGGFTFNRPAREALPSHIKIGILPDGKGCCGLVCSSYRKTVPERLRPQPLAVLLIS